jgi:CheY-like chemotaxis protein
MEHLPILIVEDEVIIRLYLADQLKRLGANVLAAVGSGEAAIEKAKALKPRLVFMDIRLTGAMDGLEAATNIVADSGAHIVFMSAFDYRKEALSRFPAGTVEFVGKPVSRADLSRILAAAS